jgi:hypothetical protein
LNYNDFVDWKRNPVTQLVFNQLEERVNLMMEQLSVSAGKEPEEDRYMAGYIAACRDMFLIEFVPPLEEIQAR